MSPSSGNAHADDLLKDCAEAALRYIDELGTIDVEKFGYDQLFAFMDEIKERLPSIPRGEEVKQCGNYQPAREAYNRAYAAVADTIRDILSKDYEAGSSDPDDSFNYRKSRIPLEAARRIVLFHHVPYKVDLIIAALDHPDDEVKRIGVAEYRALPSEVRNSTDYFHDPESFKKKVRDLGKTLQAE